MIKFKPGLVSITLLMILFPMMLSSCDKNKFTPQPEDTEANDKGEKDPEGKDEEEDPSQTEDFILLGSGTGGNLTIDGSAKSYNCKTTLKIKGGTYSSITIKNLKGQAGCPIKITNAGQIELSGNNKQLRLIDLNYVDLTGNGVTNIKYGFAFSNMRNTAIDLSGAINNFTLSHFSFKNIQTYSVISYKPKMVYNGSEDSYLKNLKFLNLEAESSGTLIRIESVEGNSRIVGLVRGIEVAHMQFRDSPRVGSVVSLGKAEDYDLHDNVIERVNSSNDNHNGLFYVQGNGEFHHNIVRDHQGNAIRAWVFSIGNSPKDVLIYNNIVFHSRQYSGFEVQAFDRDIVKGVSTFGNVKVFNNTVGDVNPKGSFPAQVLDLYTLKGGACEIFNNVGYSFHLVAQHNTNYIWNQLSTDTEPSRVANNKYYNTVAEAGITDEKTFELKENSPLKHAGETFKMLTDDFYGNQRSNPPSIGAVE